ncbi:hypothetical protein HMPREF9072_00959 [Capnocytophaga sp. oral taxon 324 str. F0483]|nr:hypothetical protein HMPREF9072_00959 [Capnocytophaga sp. oral taxon 324 str. F0483]
MFVFSSSFVRPLFVLCSSICSSFVRLLFVFPSSFVRLSFVLGSPLPPFTFYLLPFT